MRISDWSSDVCSSDLKGHECVVYDSHPEAVAQARGHGAKGCADLAELVSTLSRPRVLWLMVPAAVVDGVLESLLPLLDKDDIVIDGGNSSYHDDIRRAADLAEAGIHYMDVGTSGGVEIGRASWWEKGVKYV